MLRRTAILFSLNIVACSLAFAAEKADDKSQEEAIRAVVAALEQGFNQGDAKALAACWAENGEFVGPRGECIAGREKIEAAFQEYLAAHKNFKLRLAVASWRLVADDVALVDLVSDMTPTPEGLDSQPTSALVLVKKDGKWLVGRMHEAKSGELSHHIQLRRLAGMVGDWIEADAKPGEVAMHSSCAWTGNGAYLIRRFSAEGESGVVLAGTEVIGWDPRARRIRSWTFDSDGGFGESIWTRDGDEWIIEYTGTLANGDDVAATHVAKIGAADEFTVQSTDREVNGEKQPDLPSVAFKRQKPAESKPAEPVELPQNVLPQ